MSIERDVSHIAPLFRPMRALLPFFLIHSTSEANCLLANRPVFQMPDDVVFLKDDTKLSFLAGTNLKRAAVAENLLEPRSSEALPPISTIGARNRLTVIRTIRALEVEGNLSGAIDVTTDAYEIIRRHCLQVLGTLVLFEVRTVVLCRDRCRKHEEHPNRNPNYLHVLFSSYFYREVNKKGPARASARRPQLSSPAAYLAERRPHTRCAIPLRPVSWSTTGTSYLKPAGFPLHRGSTSLSGEYFCTSTGSVMV